MLDLHPGDEFTSEPIAAALTTTPGEVENGLDRLLTVGLITEIGAGRYRRPDVIVGGEHKQSDATRIRILSAQRAMIDWYLARTATAGRTLNPFQFSARMVHKGLGMSTFDTPAAALACSRSNTPMS
uniref:hypothetical protein n=1 Tax=Umezawaea sp. Da 62-37 TaxID=3075927 RepID=UPI0028F71AA6|nr:hypothetical protein [Umezawaea sp. Da 62-37]WNV84963.1 hypothetical protein RM788_43545 [Umezawaea sp. Da 62-37]